MANAKAPMMKIAEAVAAGGEAPIASTILRARSLMVGIIPSARTRVSVESSGSAIEAVILRAAGLCRALSGRKPPAFLQKLIASQTSSASSTLGCRPG